MPRPTAEQLQVINKFTHKEMTEDDVFVFSPLMIDDQKTSYSSYIHDSLLDKFVKDSERGVALLMNHNKRQLPAGRSFSARKVSEFDSNLGKKVTSVYGDFYIDRGRQTESNMSTDDLIKGIEAGTIFDVSIGFNASSWTCSICGNDIRDYMKCSHYPGETYEVKGNDGVTRQLECSVIAGSDGVGELLELSLVYAGACDRATIKSTFSNESVTDLDKSTKLTVVGNFKDIPMDATLYQYYTKDGSVLMTDSTENTGGSEYLRKRSEQEVEFEKIREYLKSTLGVEVESFESLETALGEYAKTITASSEELSTKVTEIENLTQELSKTKEELEKASSDLASKDETIAELEKANEELSKKAEVGETYRSDLINSTIELGVKAQGNAFQADLFTKFLSTLSIEEIKGVKDGFSKEVTTKFAGAKTTETEDLSLDKRVSEVPDKLENPTEYREFISRKAREYVVENPKTSIKDALSLMNEKYSKVDAE